MAVNTDKFTIISVPRNTQKSSMKMKDDHYEENVKIIRSKWKSYITFIRTRRPKKI
jgi:hypothetical protein